MKILYIIRGHSGSGKTTLANKLADEVVEADNYFTNNKGIYTFDASKLTDAHSYCKSVVRSLMVAEYPSHNIAVSNTFTRKWEYEPYLELAERYGYVVQEIICKGNFKNVHNVPEEVVEKQKQRFEY